MPHITNGYFHAPNHRVKHINAERLSLPYFVNLGNDSAIEPFHPFEVDGIKNTPIPYGEFLNHGLRALIEKNGQT
jgi:isopenicillin-N synthase